MPFQLQCLMQPMLLDATISYALPIRCLMLLCCSFPFFFALQLQCVAAIAARCYIFFALPTIVMQSVLLPLPANASTSLCLYFLAVSLLLCSWLCLLSLLRWISLPERERERERERGERRERRERERERERGEGGGGLGAARFPVTLFFSFSSLVARFALFVLRVACLFPCPFFPIL